MKTKRQLQEEERGIEQSVVNLGFVKKLADQTMSANQLAASGIQLSMRENLIKFIKNMDESNITQNEQKLLTALQNSQNDKIEKKEEKEENVNMEIEKEPEQQIDDSAPKSETKYDSDEASGLDFFDPQEEARIKKEKNLIEMQRNRQGLLRETTGTANNAASVAAQSSLLNVKQNNQRTNFLTQLKNKQKQKNVMTLEKVKATFQSTELINDESKKKAKTSDLLEDRESDSDFDENEHEDKAAAQIWDDEENFIDQAQIAQEGSESEQEEADESEAVDKVDAQLSQMSVDQVAVEDKVEIAEASMNSSQRADEPQRLLRKTKATEGSQASSAKAERHAAINRRRKQKLAGFFDEEAELGSDDEDKVDARKAIDRNAADENEDGLDDDLDGFVVKGDDQEIGVATGDMRAKFLADLENDEKAKMRQAMETAIFGKNRKRRRGEVDLEDESAMLNDYEKRKQQRLEEREQQLNSQDEEEMEKHLLEGGKGRAIEHLQMKQLIEEEELSEDEIKQQMEQSRYFAFLRENRRKEQLKSMEAKEKEMEAELGEFMVDLNQEAQLKRANTLPKNNDSAPETATGSNSTSKTTIVQTVVTKPVQRGIASIAAARLNQKKVQLKQPIEDGAKPKNSGIGAVATGMQRFMKRPAGNPSDTIKANLRANNTKSAVPVLFR